MKITLNTRPHGNILLIGLLTAGIICLVIAQYMNMVAQQNYSTMRSLAWNTALTVAEAGVEEAMTHLNDDSGLTDNSWTSQGNTMYRKTRAYGTEGSSYSVIISNAAVLPVIYSQGYAPGPVSTSPYGMILGTVTGSLGSSNAKRTLVVGTKKQNTQTGVYGVFTKNAINLGSDFLIDSFDSTDPAHSFNGKYQASTAKANGSLASISTTAGQIMIADSKIFGKVYSPPTGSYALGKAGVVGDQAFQSIAANAGKIEPGFYANDLNQSIPDGVPPAGWSLFTTATSSPQTINGVTYDYVLTSGNYQLGAGKTLKGKILIQGDVTLYVPSDGRIQFGSGDVISLNASLSASFKLYNASTTDVVMKDVSNDSGIASRFTYTGLPTTIGSKVTLTGSGDYAFAGTLYAPNQKVVMTGSSGGNQDFVGAITADNFTMSGHSYMHVDEALFKNASGSAKYVVNSYAEIASFAGF
jgi:hypothetical protein